MSLPLTVMMSNLQLNNIDTLGRVVYTSPSSEILSSRTVQQYSAVEQRLDLESLLCPKAIMTCLPEHLPKEERIWQLQGEAASANQMF